MSNPNLEKTIKKFLSKIQDNTTDKLDEESISLLHEILRYDVRDIEAVRHKIDALYKLKISKDSKID